MIGRVNLLSAVLIKQVGGRLANKVFTINGVGECKAFILATVIFYCLQNKRFSNAVYLGIYWFATGDTVHHVAVSSKASDTLFSRR